MSSTLISPLLSNPIPDLPVVLPKHVSKLQTGDIAILVSATEPVIGRVKSVTATHIELYKPHVLLVRPTSQNSLSINFMPYGAMTLINQRESRWFPLDGYVQIDSAESNCAKNFAAFISGIQAPPQGLQM